VHIVDMSRIKFLSATQSLGEEAIFQGSLKALSIITLRDLCSSTHPNSC
jgi:hypothetical protein